MRITTGRSAGWARSLRIALGTVLTLSLGLTCLASASSPRVAGKSKPQVLIPCFHKGTGRYTAEAQPTNCDIAGRRNRKDFVEIPVTGMRWGGWGSFRSFGAHGKTMAFTDNHRPGGTGVRVIAYRRVACGEGRTSYSWANVFFPGNGLTVEVKLPSCDARSVTD
jgi:hypothetical protein